MIADVGRNCYILSHYYNTTSEVSTSTTKVGKMCYVPIVDAMIVYEGEYSGKLYFLVVCWISWPQPDPAIVGLIVNERPKINTPHWTWYERQKYDHLIIDNNFDLHIQMNLDGVFSIFHSFTTQAPTNKWQSTKRW